MLTGVGAYLPWNGLHDILAVEAVPHFGHKLQGMLHTVEEVHFAENYTCVLRKIHKICSLPDDAFGSNIQQIVCRLGLHPTPHLETMADPGPEFAATW